jgi:hypothetical protein
MNSHVDVFGTFFFLMLATLLLFAQIGEAVGKKKPKPGPEKAKAQELEYLLREKDMKFHDRFVEQMAKECANVEHSGTAAGVVKENLFCEAKDLAIKLKELHRTKEMATKQELKQKKGEINSLRKQIHANVLADLVTLKKHYGPLLGNGMAEPIQNKFNQISKDHPNRGYLKAASKEAVVELIAELRKGKLSHIHNERMIVYKLLCIGQKMAGVFNENLEEKMEWAYQQFSLNLVIHALRLDQPNQREIQPAKSWIVDMSSLSSFSLTSSLSFSNEISPFSVVKFISPLIVVVKMALDKKRRSIMMNIRSNIDDCDKMFIVQK